MKNNHIHFFRNCILVKGFHKNTLNDLQRKEIYHIDNDFYNYCVLIDGIEFDLYCEKYKDKQNFREYYSFLHKNEIITITDTPELFPDLSMEFDFPFSISNAIIDIDTNYDYALKFINRLLEEKINIYSIQIRVFSDLNVTTIINILESLSEYVPCIHLLVKFNSSIDYSLFTKKFNNIEEIIIFNSLENEKQFTKDILFGRLVFTKELIIDENCCGNSLGHYFTSNIKFFTESKSHNNCLNKKLSIDKNGLIKNCPSMTNSYGHIYDTDLNSVINNREYKSIWDINKDLINDCNVCEFRYSCYDCRAYIVNPNNPFSKPLKCNYDPYKGEFN